VENRINSQRAPLAKRRSKENVWATKKLLVVDVITNILFKNTCFKLIDVWFVWILSPCYHRMKPILGWA